MKLLLRQSALGLALALGVCAMAGTAKAAALTIPGPPELLVTPAPQKEAPDNSERELILDIINFIILLAVLGYFGPGLLHSLLGASPKEFFANRSTSIRERLQEGAKALASAQAKLAEIEGKLAGFEKEVAELKLSSERLTEDEHRRIRQATSEEVVKIQQFAQAQIAAAVRTAKADLRLFAVREAIEQARAMISGRLDEKGEKRLVGFFLANLRTHTAKN